MASINNIIYKISAIDLLSPALRKINGEANKTDNAIAVLGRTAKLAFGAAALGIGVVIKQVIDAGTKVENARIGMTTILKDSVLAQKIIDDTIKEAVKSPFDFEQLLAGKRALISTGIAVETATQLFNDLSNAVAATGGKDTNLEAVTQLLQKTISRGQVTQKTIGQFGTNFINLAKVYRDQGKNIYDNNGKIHTSVKELVDVLHKAGMEGGTFYGGLEKMQGSITTKLSNLKDQFFETFVKIFDKIRPQIVNVINYVSDAISKFDTNVDGILDTFRNVYNFISPIFQAIGDAFTQIGDSVHKNSDLFDNLFENILKLQKPLIDIINLIGDITTKLIDITNLANKTFHLLDIWVAHFQFIVDVVTTLWKIIKGIGGLIKDIISGDWNAFWDDGTKGAQGMKNVFIEIKDLFGDAWGFIKKIHGIKDEVDTTTGDAAKALSLSMGKGIDIFGKELIPLPKKGPGQFNPFPLSDRMGGSGKKSTSGISGPKITTINIYMDNLIESFTINSSTLKEGAESAKDIVTRALSQSLADSQLIVH